VNSCTKLSLAILRRQPYSRFGAYLHRATVISVDDINWYPFAMFTREEFEHDISLGDIGSDGTSAGQRRTLIGSIYIQVRRAEKRPLR
jgi:hypothetical protein